MIEHYLSTSWNVAAPAIGNHLWQSTLVALAAGVLTLAVRRHNAHIRYFLWLAASVKFLIPFSFLISLGQLFAWRSSGPALQRATVLYAVEEIGQPFTRTATQVASPHVSGAPAVSVHWLPWLGLAWLAGFIAVLLLWIVRWHRISAQMKSAEQSSQGRELEILRRVERIGGLRKSIGLLLSSNSLEPGIVGIVRPVLLWPEGISKHLHDEQLEAILAHEVWHVRRRDNLFASLHMLVEAIFWFYPPVWWIGSRLVDERERSCDEEVVASGSDRQVYAESILKVCEFCLGSPLPCVAGVTGADLKKRMVHIMNDRILHKLDFARKLLLTAAAFLAIAVPITFGLLHATPSRAQSQPATSNFSGPVLSSVSIKPHDSADRMRSKMFFSLKDGSFVAEGVTLQRLIQMAYHVQDEQISGPDDLLNKPKFDIQAALDPAFVAAMHQQTSAGKPFDDQAMLKSILAERFKLVAHFEAKTLPTYDLLVDDNGPKLQEASGIRMMHMEHGEISSTGTPMAFFCEQLSLRLGRMVVDKTGLKGSYVFDLHWTPDVSEEERLENSGEGERSITTIRAVNPNPDQAAKLQAEQAARTQQFDPNAPSLLVALQQQLGLKLEPQTEPVQVLVIDHAEVPSQN